MYWHIDSDLICLCILIIIFFDVRRKNRSTLRQDKLFAFIIGWTICVAIIDIAASLVMELPVSWFLYQLVETLYFIILPSLALFWFYYTCAIAITKSDKKKKLAHIIATVEVAIYELIALSNPFTGALFTLSEGNVYSRGSLFWLALAMFALISLETVITILVNHRQIFPRSRIGILLCCPLLVAAGVAFQLLIPGQLLTIAAYTLSYILTYIYIQNRRDTLDGLTGVLNRASGEQRIRDFLLSHRKSDADGAFILADIDGLKAINDILGHAAGDRAIRITARAFISTFNVGSIVSRYGGDEFVIFREHINNKTELFAQLDRVNAFVSAKSLAENGERMTLSIGVAFFPESGSYPDELYENADQALHIAKATGKDSYVVYNRRDCVPLRSAMPTGDRSAINGAD